MDIGHMNVKMKWLMFIDHQELCNISKFLINKYGDILIEFDENNLFREPSLR